MILTADDLPVTLTGHWRNRDRYKDRDREAEKETGSFRQRAGVEVHGKGQKVETYTLKES